MSVDRVDLGILRLILESRAVDGSINKLVNKLCQDEFQEVADLAASSNGLKELLDTSCAYFSPIIRLQSSQRSGSMENKKIFF